MICEPEDSIPSLSATDITVHIPDVHTERKPEEISTGGESQPLSTATVGKVAGDEAQLCKSDSNSSLLEASLDAGPSVSQLNNHCNQDGRSSDNAAEGPAQSGSDAAAGDAQSVSNTGNMSSMSLSTTKDYCTSRGSGSANYARRWKKPIIVIDSKFTMLRNVAQERNVEFTLYRE